MRTLLAPALALFAGCASVETADASVQLAWIEQESGTDASLRGISAVSERVAWASGSDGTWRRTTDGGETWGGGRVPGSEELDFRDVHAFSPERALLVSAGEPARFVLTEDGGRSWRTVHADTAPGVFFDAVEFWDARRGLAFSDPLEGRLHLVRTGDGGATWTPVAAPPAALPGEAGFAASGTCLEVLPGSDRAWVGLGGDTGRAARVLRTLDGGATWSAHATPFPASASAGVFSVAFLDAERGVLVGGDYRAPEDAEPTAATTSDGGATWIPAVAPPRGYRSAVCFVPDRAGPVAVAAGPTGVDVSIDGGRSWIPLHATGYHALDLLAGGGWAVGAEGRVARVVVHDGQF